MWRIVESKAAVKALAKAPHEVIARYDIWLGIVRVSGPHGLRAVKGFHDEKLEGKLEGTRSSRLGDKWRVYYKVDANSVSVHVENVDAHKYGK